jgi:hypothetical protein
MRKSTIRYAGMVPFIDPYIDPLQNAFCKGF